jgi:hypothetical protein
MTVRNYYCSSNPLTTKGCVTEKAVSTNTRTHAIAKTTVIVF